MRYQNNNENDNEGVNDNDDVEESMMIEDDAIPLIEIDTTTTTATSSISQLQRPQDDLEWDDDAIESCLELAINTHDVPSSSSYLQDDCADGKTTTNKNITSNDDNAKMTSMDWPMPLVGCPGLAVRLVLSKEELEKEQRILLEWGKSVSTPLPPLQQNESKQSKHEQTPQQSTNVVRKSFTTLPLWALTTITEPTHWKQS